MILLLQYTIGHKQSIQRIFEVVKFSAIQNFQSFYSTGDLVENDSSRKGKKISYTPGVNTETILEVRKTMNEITEALAKHL